MKKCTKCGSKMELVNILGNQVWKCTKCGKLKNK